MSAAGGRQVGSDMIARNRWMWTDGAVRLFVTLRPGWAIAG